MKNNPLVELGNLFLGIQATDRQRKSIDLEKAIAQVCEVVLRQSKKGAKVIIVGNGGSASIASHIAADFIKNLNTPALSFSDPSLLTCLSNDLGYEKVFSAPIGVMAKKGDILFAVSSSGKSRNILNAAIEGKKRGCFVVSFSGFLPNNPLRKKGDVNFYVPSLAYGAVEITHLAICHAIVDILYKK